MGDGSGAHWRGEEGAGLGPWRGLSSLRWAEVSPVWKAHAWPNPVRRDGRSGCVSGGAAPSPAQPQEPRRDPSRAQHETAGPKLLPCCSVSPCVRCPVPPPVLVSRCAAQTSPTRHVPPLPRRVARSPSQVPNVRLRPAQAVPRKPTLRDLPSADSGFDSDADASFVDSCPRPLRGVVVCATGINDKVCLQPLVSVTAHRPLLQTTLFKQAIELGAQPLHDLTDRVTHLIALEPGSEKYKVRVTTRQTHS